MNLGIVLLIVLLYVCGTRACSDIVNDAKYYCQPGQCSAQAYGCFTCDAGTYSSTDDICCGINQNLSQLTIILH